MRGAPPLRDFMLKQTRESRPGALRRAQHGAAAGVAERICRCAWSIPAFAISELKTGFQMGFFLFVPFLLIDLVVSDDAAVDGHDAAAAGDDLAAVQDSAVRDGRRLESAGRVAGAELRSQESRHVRCTRRRHRSPGHRDGGHRDPADAASPACSPACWSASFRPSRRFRTTCWRSFPARRHLRRLRADVSLDAAGDQRVLRPTDRPPSEFIR